MDKDALAEQIEFWRKLRLQIQGWIDQEPSSASVLELVQAMEIAARNERQARLDLKTASTR